MTTARHLQAVPDDNPDRTVSRNHPAWRSRAWWRLLDEYRALVEARADQVPWERHPARTAQHVEFRAP